MPVDLARMEATRVPRSGFPAVASRSVAPPPKLSRLLADVCVLSVRGGKCLICGGASWVGPHEVGCPLETAMILMSKNGWFRKDGLHVSTPDYVTRAKDGGVLIYGVPYERFIHTDLDQRDVIRRRHEKGRKCKVLRIRCHRCQRDRYEVRPAIKGQMAEECAHCFHLRSMSDEQLKTYIESNAAEAKGYAAKGLKHAARMAAGKAKLAMAILRGA